MTNQQTAFQNVSNLVKDFRANESKFLSPDYSEADVRKDFIDKFFFALGWDVYHDEQKNPYEQEVKIEKSVYVGKQQKRADYAFYLTPNFRDVKFYVEAKKPSRNLSNADNYFQSIRYGWNAGTQITFLTDFEEFHILDCRIKPDISSILNNKIKQYHYSDFLNEEKFSEIYWLLSREAVANNSLEKFAESLTKPKGKVILKGTHRGIYQSIDEAFLEELDEIRNSLAKAFKKANPHLESEPLTEMTQRMIDRLVFIRFLEDKQIEPDHYVSEFANSKTAWKDFKIASRKLDAKYNGVVFKKHTIDSNNFAPPDDKTFSLICEGLAHLNSPYNFDIIPIHILGSIYERFLGKIVIATDKRVRIEEKPEVRKAGGVYYTPQYIVNYIVDNTVGKLIEGKTPKEISSLRFADISCGSGSFLITVFDRILEYHRKWYQDNPAQAKKDGCYFLDGKWVLSLKQKQKILTNNIFGVDLDHQAVEVTQLSLYLKLLEDETTATAQDTWVMFKEQLLPNLNNNIVCGNSLIGTDILENNLFNSVEMGYIPSLQSVDELKLKPMNFEDAFPEVMRQGGFDAIVGNPPYVFTRDVEFGELVKTYYKENYLSLIEKSDKSKANQTGKANLFALFILKGIKLINGSGSFSYIIPNTILRTTVYEGVRKYLLDNTSIERIVDLKAGVFKGVTASTVILILGKEKKEKQIKIIDNPIGVNSIEGKLTSIDKNTFYQNPSYSFNIFVDTSDELIFEKMKSKSERLENIVDVYNGIATFKNKEGLGKIQKNKHFKKILLGKNIGRYSHLWDNYFIEYIRSKLQRPREEWIFLAEEKLIMQRIGGILITSYDNEKYYTFNSVNNILLKNRKYSLKFILGILNSKLLRYYYIRNFTNESSLTVNISKTYLDKLPMPNIDFIDTPSSHRLTELVDQITETKKAILIAKTESEKEYLEKKCSIIDKQIDQLVYELYGLTEEEIKIVEGN